MRSIKTSLEAELMCASDYIINHLYNHTTIVIPIQLYNYTYSTILIQLYNYTYTTILILIQP